MQSTGLDTNAIAVVAEMLPLPEVPRLPPVPINKEAVLVAEDTEENGRLVPLLRLTATGVPRFGEISVGEFPNTSDPVPVLSLIAAAKLADDGTVKKVKTPDPVPDIPDTGAVVAAIDPLPVADRLAPDPTTITAVVFVPLVRSVKDPPPPPPVDGA